MRSVVVAVGMCFGLVVRCPPGQSIREWLVGRTPCLLNDAPCPVPRKPDASVASTGLRGTEGADVVDLSRDRHRDGLTGWMEIPVGNEFLTASSDAAARLQRAQREHASMKARADRRLQAAQDRHRTQLAEAAAIEAAGWLVLLAVPGMTVTTAARIGGTSESTVSRWLTRAKDPSCT